MGNESVQWAYHGKLDMVYQIHIIKLYEKHRTLQVFLLQYFSVDHNIDVV